MTDHTKMTEAELLLAAAKLADEQSKRVVAPGWEDYVAMRYRLTALADRLRDGCVVPRVFVETMRCPNADYESHDRHPCDWCKRRAEWLKEASDADEEKRLAQLRDAHQDMHHP